MSIDWNLLINESKENADILYKILQALVVSSKRKKESDMFKHYPVIGFLGGVALYHRKPTVSSLQHAIGLILEHGGTSDEV